MTAATPRTGWRECSLGNLMDISHGYAFKGEFFSEEPTDHILLTPGNFKIGGGFKADKLKFYKGDFPTKYILQPNDIVVTMTDLSKEADTLGYSAVVPEIKGKQVLHNQRIGRVKLKSDLADIKFINWVMRTAEYRWHIIGSASGSTVSHTSPARILGYKFMLPPLQEQRAIAAVLSSLDDKIDLLHRQNTTIEALGLAYWRNTFVDNSVSDLQTKPLSKFFQVKTGKKDANHSTPDGGYPFFTCSQDVLKSPTYSFEGHALLLAGNGDFNLKRYNGKFEAYQRTYVLIPNNKFLVGFLYFGMQHHLDDITLGYRGSVINFITKGMIENFEIPIIPDEHNFKQICEFLNEINAKTDSNKLQIDALIKTRDTLLTKLMSGEIEV